MTTRISKTRLALMAGTACLLTIAAVCGDIAIVRAAPQDADAVPFGNLDKMVDAALERNPDVLVAVAKVREAEAELNRRRLEVVRDVVAIQNERRQQELQIGALHAKFEHAKALAGKGVATADEVQAMEFEIMSAQARIEDIEARARFLLGGGRGSAKRTASSYAGGDAATTSSARLLVGRGQAFSSEVAKVLELKVEVSVEEASIGDVATLLMQQTGPALKLTIDPSLVDLGITLNVSGTLENVLKAIHDATPLENMTAVYRDYGFFWTTAENALRLWGPAIPQEAKIDATFVPQRVVPTTR